MALERDLHDHRVLVAELGRIDVDRVALDHALGLELLDARPAAGGRETDLGADVLQGLARIEQQNPEDRHVDLVEKSFVILRRFAIDFHVYGLNIQKSEANSASNTEELTA